MRHAAAQRSGPYAGGVSAMLVRAAMLRILSRGSCGGGVAFPGKALSRVQREAGGPLVNNARWRAGEAPVPDSTARNS